MRLLTWASVWIQDKRVLTGDYSSLLITSARRSRRSILVPLSPERRLVLLKNQPRTERTVLLQSAARLRCIYLFSDIKCKVQSFCVEKNLCVIIDSY